MSKNDLSYFHKQLGLTSLQNQYIQIYDYHLSKVLTLFCQYLANEPYYMPYATFTIKLDNIVL